MLVWDNQQETSWFVGILEGEGSCYRNNGNRCKISITNTEIDLINHCINYLKRNHIHYIITEQQPKIKRYKRIYQIVISSINECNILIKTIQDKFQCRYQEFINKLNLGSSTTTRDATLKSDLFWLVGICEAEGSIGLNIDHEKYYYPAISIKNTKQNIIEKIAITLYSEKLSWYVQEYKHPNPAHNLIYIVRIRGMQRCFKFLLKLENLWHSQYYKNRANLLLEFLRSRFSKNQKRTLFTKRNPNL